MQTKQHIQQLLAGAGVRPNKRLGQNFLIDLNLMKLLVSTAGLGRGDVVLVVGTGTGALTEAIAEAAGRVVSVEFDETLGGIAAGELGGADNVELIGGDVLENKSTLNREVVGALERAVAESGGRMVLVANLPYNIATPLMINLMVLGRERFVCEGMYVTVQREVAQRMAAGPGCGSYGLLGILMAALGEVRIIRKLGPSVFWPVPQVDSAMVSFKLDAEKAGRIEDVGLFRDVAALFMAHRRKMLKGCVKSASGRLAEIGGWDDLFAEACIDPHCRGEELTAENYISLSNLCKEHF